VRWCVSGDDSQPAPGHAPAEYVDPDADDAGNATDAAALAGQMVPEPNHYEYEDVDDNVAASSKASPAAAEYLVPVRPGATVATVRRICATAAIVMRPQRQWLR